MKRVLFKCTDLDCNQDVRYRIVIDQRAGQKPLLNYAGWPANEITLLMKLSSDDPLAHQIESGLLELPSSKVDNSILSNEEILKGVVPKYVGTLGEYLRYLDTLPLSPSERSMLEESAKEKIVDDVDTSDVKSDDSVDS